MKNICLPVVNLVSRVLPKGIFSKNILTLITGTALAQAIPIAIAPILTRLYTPEDFGGFALYIAISSIVAVAATGRYELAIMLPKKDSDASGLVVVSIAVSFIISLLILITVFLFDKIITLVLWNPEINCWLYFVPLSVLLTGIYQSLTYWNNRKKYYKRLAINRIIQNSAMSCSHVIAGIIGLGSGGLISGTIFGQGVATLALGILLWKEDKTIITATTSLKKLALSRRYINFPKYLVFSHMLNSASFQSPNLLLNVLFNSLTAGYYMLTRRVISVPISIVARAIGDVFRQEASHDFAHKGQCVEVYKKTLKRLVLIAIIPFLVFFFIAPDLFAFVFGEPWRVAGKYAQILTPMVFMQFVTSPLSLMFMVAEKQRFDLIWQVLLFVMTSSSLVIGYIFDSVTYALIMFSFSYSFMYLIGGVMSAIFARGEHG